jgi:hypothetical protein
MTAERSRNVTVDTTFREARQTLEKEKSRLTEEYNRKIREIDGRIEAIARALGKELQSDTPPKPKPAAEKTVTSKKGKAKAKSRKKKKTKKKGSKKAKGPSIPEATMAFLRQAKKGKTRNEIFEALKKVRGEFTKGSLGQALNSLRKNGLIRHGARRGQWIAVKAGDAGTSAKSSKSTKTTKKKKKKAASKKTKGPKKPPKKSSKEKATKKTGKRPAKTKPKKKPKKKAKKKSSKKS